MGKKRLLKPHIWQTVFIAFLTVLLVTGIGYTQTIPPVESVKIASKGALVHLGSIDTYNITPGGSKAASLMLEGLEKQDKALIAQASQIYDEIIPKENFGGEYTALQWFCDYILGSPSEQQAMVEEPLVSEFFNFFAANDYAVLKEYLERKYDLASLPDENTEPGKTREAYLEDFILFNNPRREEWEQSSKIVKALQLHPGLNIADIGSGPGYYTFKFAEAVGKEGQVYAIDTVQAHLDYVGKLKDKYGIDNINLVHTKGDTVNVAQEQVDLAFMCSLYHIIYITSQREATDAFVNSIKKALKPDGTLVIVDNAFVDESEIPYHGPYIAKELIIGQLEHYGFKLVGDYQFIPQRYVLAFQMTGA